MTDTPTPPDFNSATYYACDEPEHLTHTHPVDALEDYLSNMLYEPDQSLLDCIKEHAPIEVTGYARKEISAEQLLLEAQRLVERFVESMAEEFGDPDGDFLAEGGEETLTQALAKVLEAHRHLYDVWACDPVCTKEYSEEELLTLFKDRIVEEEAKP